ncbi:MAG: hypothetical protein OXJ64_06375 [Boseongicola sp.]|nr:hypothetical protein [Boseongicola sp.]
MKASDIDLLAATEGQAVPLDNLLWKVDRSGRATWQDLPTSPGVYAVCLSDWEVRAFTRHAGRARHASPADVSQLSDKRDQILAAGPTDILYIGKAGGRGTRTLRNRIRELARFGAGRALNHRGGARLWQLDGIDEAHVHMWCCPRGRAESLESELLDRFRTDHGDWPFANCVGGFRS